MKYSFLLFRALSCLGIGAGALGLTLFTVPEAFSQTFIQNSNNTTQTVHLNPEDTILVQRVQQWINNLTSLKGNFQQIAPDSQRSTGIVWIKRPGRIRFQYDPPSKISLIANEGKIVFNDRELGQTTTIPTDQSPLGLLLKKQLTFSGGVTIVGFSHQNGYIQVTLVRTASPDEGNLTLVFYDTPIQLRSWQVIDAQGQRTQVDLFNIKYGVSVSDRLFNIHVNDEDN